MDTTKTKKIKEEIECKKKKKEMLEANARTKRMMIEALAQDAVCLVKVLNIARDGRFDAAEAIRLKHEIERKKSMLIELEVVEKATTAFLSSKCQDDTTILLSDNEVRASFQDESSPSHKTQSEDNVLSFESVSKIRSTIDVKDTKRNEDKTIITKHEQKKRDQQQQARIIQHKKQQLKVLWEAGKVTGKIYAAKVKELDIELQKIFMTRYKNV